MGHGGYRPGSGKKPLPDELKNNKGIFKFLRPSLAFINECLQEEASKDLKKWATELVLRKTIPDKRATEVTGEGGGDIKIKIVQEAVKSA